MINVKSFIDDLKCSICLDFFYDPRTLGCQHSFCFGCLERNSFQENISQTIEYTNKSLFYELKL